jgi:putative Mg2+ transporter-C (MgtC) family protein
MLTLTTVEIITRIAYAIGLGSVVGLERTFAGKGAGMRTYAMVSLGSSIFIIISETVLSQFPDQALANPMLVASAIITGVGFIGAGLTIFKDHGVIGLTTAAGLWVAAGIGIASGFGLFNIAIAAAVGGLVVFTILWFIEKTLKKFSYKGGNHEQ